MSLGRVEHRTWGAFNAPAQRKRRAGRDGMMPGQHTKKERIDRRRKDRRRPDVD